jgi:DHA1 family inner membrane transport protein
MQSSPTAGALSAPADTSRSGLQILIMAVAAFIIVTTEFLIVGLLPALARDLNISIALAGQVVTLFAFTVMLFGPLLTAKLAHVERKKLFTVILLVFAASNVLAAVSTNIWVLALARFIPALALPVFWGTASETAGQLAGPGQSGKAVGRVYLGITAALVFGVPLGTLAADSVGWRGSFWILAGLSLFIGVLMHWLMPRLPVSVGSHPGQKQTAILREPRFLAHLLLSILTFTALFTAYTYLADILERLGGIPAAQVGWWLMGFGAVGMIGNHLGGSLVDRKPLAAMVLFLVLVGIGPASCLADGRHGCLGYRLHRTVRGLPGARHASRRQGPGAGRVHEYLGRQCGHRPGGDHWWHRHRPLRAGVDRGDCDGYCGAGHCGGGPDDAPSVLTPKVTFDQASCARRLS